MPTGQPRRVSSVGQTIILCVAVEDHLRAFDPYTTFGPSGSMDKLWEVGLGANIVSSPTLSGGSVYVGRDTSISSNFYKVDAHDGTGDWSVALDHDVRSSPTVKDGYVYVGGGEFADDGKLYKLDTDDGSEDWSVSSGGVNLSTPVVSDGVVAVCGQRQGSGEVSYDPGVKGYKVSDGSKVFGQEVNEDAFAFDGSHCYVQIDSETIAAIAISDGSQVDTIDILNDSMVQPVYADGVLYVNTKSGNLYAIDVADVARGAGSNMSQKWMMDFATPIGSLFVSPPLYHNGFIYFQEGENDTLYCLNADDGSVKWSDDTYTGITTTPTALGNVLYVVHAANLVAYDARSGDKLFEHTFADGDVSDPGSPVLGSPHGDGYGQRSNLGVWGRHDR
jgi:outer membrane protein assembly factor BamB